MTFNGTLKRAIFETLAYSDIFEYPLQLKELHRYLPAQSTLEELSAALADMQAEVRNEAGFYFLAGREEIVEIRKTREAHSKQLLPVALKCGRVLGALPFVRMVALTGSLAVMNVSKDADFDYMIVTVPGRVWTARAFALLFNRATKLLGHTLCPNLIMAETRLEWPLHDLYSARELLQMIPITGMDVYQKLIKANEWVKEYLPNGSQDTCRRDDRATTAATTFQPFFEFFLHGKLGNLFEQWEMKRKIARFSKQAGFGEETIFTADICQGNFHHHRTWTKEALEQKLSALAAVLGSDLVETPSPGTAMEAGTL